MIRPYVALLSARFRTLLQYRAAAFAGFTTQLFWGGIRMMVFLGFYENAPADIPMSYTQVVTYIWLGQAFLGLFPYRGDGEVAQMIRSGNVAYEMLRPVDLYSMWLARSLANRTAPTILRATPMLIVAALVGWLPWPGWGALAAFCLLMAGAAMISAAVTMLMNVSLFYTISGNGISLMISGFMFILSGMIVPLPFFPRSFQFVLNLFPFRAMCDVPFRLFAGDIDAGELPSLLALQVGWILALVLVGRLLLRRATRRLVVQGG